MFRAGFYVVQQETQNVPSIFTNTTKVAHLFVLTQTLPTPLKIHLFFNILYIFYETKLWNKAYAAPELPLTKVGQRRHNLVWLDAALSLHTEFWTGTEQPDLYCALRVTQNQQTTGLFLKTWVLILHRPF